MRLRGVQQLCTVQAVYRGGWSLRQEGDGNRMSRVFGQGVIAFRRVKADFGEE
jgi:hypothetical protein